MFHRRNIIYQVSKLILYVVNDMRRWLLGLVPALAVFGAVPVISYAGITHFYGEARAITSTQTIVIEDWGEQVTIDNVQYKVTDAELCI
jgi:hypothetical protein